MPYDGWGFLTFRTGDEPVRKVVGRPKRDRSKNKRARKARRNGRS